ncbi:MAG: transcription factor S [Thermoproteus sp. AZ2]|uniref:Transcription factor S n=1 Tax=Thermoproteus sp. AZ2 TaxID=1609232 RepID=A0ACC6UZL6_9CREN|nr:MAG: DNA-directed RNA polymerase subunit M [Thermoproteus sp. AZ2]
MRFCPRDGTLLMPVRRGASTVLRCPKCGYEEPVDEGSKAAYRSRATIDKKNDVLVASQALEALPKTKAVCPRCGNEEAYVWMQQTRAADEPPTRFYRCTRCGYTWREYA